MKKSSFLINTYCVCIWQFILFAMFCNELRCYWRCFAFVLHMFEMLWYALRCLYVVCYVWRDCLNRLNTYPKHVPHIFHTYSCLLACMHVCLPAWLHACLHWYVYWFIVMCTHVHRCVLMCWKVYWCVLICVLMCTDVYWFVFVCIDVYWYVYWFILICNHVHRCVLICADVYLCALIGTHEY